MKLLKFFLLPVVAIFLASSGRAQTNAYDDAYHYVYASATWYNFYTTNIPPVNYGFGFTPWAVRTNGPANHGFFTTRNGTPLPAISSPTNCCEPPGNNTNAHAWGIFANGTGANSASMFRGFSNALDTTVTFKIQWENLGIGNTVTNFGGFALRNGNETNSTGDNFTSARFAFYYIGGGSNSFAFLDGDGIQYIGIPFTTTPFQCEFTLKPDNKYRFVAKNLVTGAIRAILNDRPLAASGTIDSVALFAQQTDANQNFNRMQIASSALNLPTILNVVPVNGSIYLDATMTNISFEADADAGISSNGVSLVLNGVAQTNLLFSAAGFVTQLFVTNNTPLQPNQTYNATIVVTDSNNNKATNTFSFNTWRPDDPFIEAEDYNFSSGIFLSDSFPNPYGAYAGLLGVNGIDYLETNPSGTNNVYRPSDLPQIEVATDADHAGYQPSYTDYNVSFNQKGEWQNYTRVMSNTTYTVYARASGFGGNGTMEISRLANPRALSSNQPLASLGTCVVPHTGGTQVYTFIPLTDFFSNPVQIHFAGTNTFRCSVIGDSGSYNLTYLIFVPNTNAATLTPYLSAGYPYPGAIGVGLDQTISFTIANRQTAVNPATVELFLNGSNVTANITLSNNAAGTAVTYVPVQFLPANSTNTLTAVFADNGGSPTTTTNSWQFVTVNALSTTIPPAYALPIGFSTTRGFVLRMNKADDSAPNPPFSATIARAEAQLAGTIINTNTSQPYTNLAAGPNGDGRYAETNVINYDISAQTTGSFPGDTAFPYIPASGTNNNIAMEALMFLQLTNGNYVFAVRSDDGFKLTAGPVATDTNLVLGFFDGGRGNTTPSIFYVTVQTNGLYPMRLLYYQAGSGGNVEFYSLNGGTPVLINDSSNLSAVKAFQVSLALPVTLLGPGHSGNTATFSFVTQSGHIHYVEYKNSLNDGAWTPLMTIAGNGSLTNVIDSTATSSVRFYHVKTQ